MPGSPAKVTITHVDQEIPSSIRQKIPINVNMRRAIYGD